MSLALFFWLGVGGPASAQWSDDPVQNLAVADLGGDQVQAKIAVRPGGGYYVSWFDNRTGGYDVYLQLLDEQGVEQWSHNGVLVADRSFSSTEARRMWYRERYPSRFRHVRADGSVFT